MKPVKIIWIAVVLICLAVGLWQRENIQLIWREYTSLYTHIKYEGYMAKRCGPFIPSQVAKQDPEAAAVAEISLGYPDRDWGEETDAVSEKLLTYPDNKFLLVELVRNIFWRNSAIDQQITLKFADRLVALEPNNANYHYMKCSLLLAGRLGNNIDAAIQELKYANTCTKYDFLDTTYKQRAIDIADKAKVGHFLMPELWYLYYMGNPAVRDIWQKLTAQANAAFTDGDTNKGMRITDTLAQMQNHQLRDGYRDTINPGDLMFFSGPYMSGYGGQPQGLELQRTHLTKERAKEDRLQLCALTVASLKRVDEYKERKEKEKQAVRKKQAEIQASLSALPPAVHAGEMSVAFLLSCLIIFLISKVCGFGEKNKIGLWSILFFITACTYYFLIVKGLFWVAMLNLGSDCCYAFSYLDIFRPPPLVTHLTVAKPMHAGVFLAGPIVVALVLWGLSFLNPRKVAFWKFWYLRVLAALVIGIATSLMTWAALFPWEEFWPKYTIVGIFATFMGCPVVLFAWWIFRWRLTRLFLLTTFLSVVTLLAYSYRLYIHYLPMAAFILIASIIAVIKPDEGSAFKTVLRFFSSKPDVAAVRNKCLRLLAPFVIICWLSFTVLAPLVAKSVNLQIGEFKPVERRGTVLPDPNQAYHEVITRFDANSFTKMNVNQLLGLVMPEDLTALVQKLKNKEFEGYGYYKSSLPAQISEQERAKLENLRKLRQRLNDDDLISAMRGCGKDAVSIITGFLDDPDTDRALVARAKLGDSNAKEKLEQLLLTRTQSELEKKKDKQAEPNRYYFPTPVKSVEIIPALACISEPNEAAERFIDYIRNRSVTDLIENNELFYGLSLLPTTQARKVAKAYLDKTLVWHPSENSPIRYTTDSPLHVFSYRPILYMDNQIAQDVFKIMLLSTDAGEHFEPYEISPYFTIESAPLLKKGLDSKNGDMRAWCVWQLRKIGYKFDKIELDKLMQDENWKVRANAVFAGGKDVAPLAAKDKHAFVRLVSSF